MKKVAVIVLGVVILAGTLFIDLISLGLAEPALAALQVGAVAMILGAAGASI